MDRGRNLILGLVVLGLLFLVGYKLASQGKLNFNLLKLPQLSNSPIIQNNQTRTVVQEEDAVISAVEKTSSSVVAIGLTQRVINPFNPVNQGANNQQNQTIGTGFVVDQGKGLLVTNRHVVSDTTVKYSVVTKDGKKLDIQKIYRDPNIDIAIVQVSGVGIPPAIELGDSAKLKVGQIAIAIGNALGRFDNTVTTGVVSGIGRAVTAGDPFSGQTEQLDNLVQTDAAINPGNSGGPLLNSSGQVIGVNVATTEGAQNIGFAVPINSVKSLVVEFSANGTISRAFLGVRYRLITRDLALLNAVPQGAYIQEIVASSPAEKAGIKPGDIITKIDGQAISSNTKISEVVQSKKVGQTVSLEIWTDSQTKTVTATLAEAPGQ